MIDVVWLSWHKEDVLARGYADQGFLEDMFSGEVWSPSLRHEFEHHEVHDDFGERFSDGAIVILPARHHTSEDDVARFLSNLDMMAWSLVILSGDEGWEFPWADVDEHDTRKVWIMQPRPEHAHLSGLIPGGPYPWVRSNLVHLDRSYDFFFAGQVTHLRRRECVRYLHRIRQRPGIVIETEGYLQGIPRDEYMKTLCQSKFVPCPSGPLTVDTARPLEAMEAGCVPVVDTKTPEGTDMTGYWSLIFGEDHPLPMVSHWSQFPQYLQKKAGDWLHLSNTVFSFWQGWKRDITEKLHGQLVQLSDEVPTEERITVIVSTSPAPLHPSLDHIRTVINSIRERLPTAEILIACDGVREEDSHLLDAYQTYLHDLLWAANTEWHNVWPIVMPEFLHQANAVKEVLKYVHTPYVLFVEHDTPLEGPIDFPDIANAMIQFPDHIHEVRFHFDVDLHPEHEPLHFGDIEVFAGTEDSMGIPLRRMRAWWARPFMIRTDVFRDLVNTHFTPESRTFLEDKLYGILHSDWCDNGEEAWGRWKIWTYMPAGNIKRSGHLDSRGAMPKHEMIW